MDLNVIKHFLDNSLALGGAAIILAYIGKTIFPRVWKKDDRQFQRDNDRENALLKRVFDSTDAQVGLTKEVSKNMAEGNVILTSLGQHMAEMVRATENIAKRLEVSEAKIEERHMANVASSAKMYEMWEEIHTAVMQNAGDARQTIQKHESGQRVGKKLKVKEVLV
jgi:hypothetical protein